MPRRGQQRSAVKGKLRGKNVSLSGCPGGREAAFRRVCAPCFTGSCVCRRNRGRSATACSRRVRRFRPFRRRRPSAPCPPPCETHPRKGCSANRAQATPVTGLARTLVTWSPRPATCGRFDGPRPGRQGPPQLKSLIRLSPSLRASRGLAQLMARTVIAAVREQRDGAEFK